MKKKILVAGSMNMDMVIDLEEMPAEGETVSGKSLRYLPGGKGANQACAVGKLGGDGWFLGCAGKDDFGKELLGSVAKSGIHVDRVRLCEEKPTGTAVIYVNSRGANSIVVVAGANEACGTDYLDEQDELFRECDYLVIQMEIPDESVWSAIRKAKRYGKTVLLNPAPAPAFIPEEILCLVDYLIPNETELAKLSGETGSDPEAVERGAKRLLGKGVGKVLVTLGERGALLADRDGCRSFPAKKVHAVDTTAAGDCFIGAFAVGLSEGMEDTTAISFANEAAALAVTRKGAQISLPAREEMKKER